MTTVAWRANFSLIILFYVANKTYKEVLIRRGRCYGNILVKRVPIQGQ